MGLIHHVSNAVSEQVIGAAIEVHRPLGPGLLESTYQACLCRELELRGQAYRRQRVLPLEYKGVKCSEGYVVDLIVEGMLVVEIKAVEALHSVHSAQLLTYMRLLEIPAGLLINFNVDRLVRGVVRRIF